MHSPLTLSLLFLANFAAGIMNTLAGGGSFLTFPALLATGLDARSANMTSTLALFPMQVATGFAGRQGAGGTSSLSLRALTGISLAGGLLGAGLLLVTPPDFFKRLVPWLILFATLIFAYGSFVRKSADVKTQKPLGAAPAGVIQFFIAIYGGYFGGGIGFLMLAALTLSGMDIRKAGASKNILAAVMNASAVALFAFSHAIGWAQAGIGAVASVLGGLLAVRWLQRVDARLLRAGVVCLGLALTGFMFVY